MVSLREFRSLGVRRFLSLECSLQSKDKFQGLSNVVKEYFDFNHAEPVPEADLSKPCKDVFYIRMHVVMKARVKHHHQDQSGLWCMSKVVHRCFSQRPTDGWSNCAFFFD